MNATRCPTELFFKEKPALQKQLKYTIRSKTCNHHIVSPYPKILKKSTHTSVHSLRFHSILSRLNVYINTSSTSISQFHLNSFIHSHSPNMPTSSETPISSDMPQLSEQLKEASTRARAMMPPTLIKSMESALSSLIQTHTPTPLSVGEHAPKFSLPNASGDPVSLEDLLQQHSAVVLTWYRGSWCPFCNLALRALTQAYPKFEALGAKLVALTPQTAIEHKQLIDQFNIPFPVLIDDDLQVADKFGVAFQVKDDMKAFLEQVGVNLDLLNGNHSNRAPRLPLPATFVIAKNGTVAYAFADMDYTKRAEPAHVLQVVQKLVQ